MEWSATGSSVSVEEFAVAAESNAHEMAATMLAMTSKARPRVEWCCRRAHFGPRRLGDPAIGGQRGRKTGTRVANRSNVPGGRPERNVARVALNWQKTLRRASIVS